MIPPEKIRAFVRLPVADEPRIPLPTLSEVLYAGPNRDGSRKQCGNCYKFLISGGCVEVAGEILPSTVCGYHVFGTPQMATPLFAEAGVKMSAVDAGLIETLEGVSCDRCRFFDNSLCDAIASEMDTTPPVVVDALGCCTRYERDATLED